VIPDFYTAQPDWPERVEHIVEMLGRVAALEELSGRKLELRRGNRIGSVHSSTAIEGNQLTLAQVEALALGGSVVAPPREVLEVTNALAAYDALSATDGDAWEVVSEKVTGQMSE
jgi:Fic family protein